MMVGISDDVKDIGDNTKEIDKNLSNKFFSTVVMVNTMNNTMENFMNYQTKIDSIFQVHPLKLSDYKLDKPRKNGRVAKWYNIKNNEEFAFKIILGKKDENIIQNQVTILKELHDCQNIIKYYGFTRDENKWYLVTEWAEYGNLREFYTNYKSRFDLRLKLRMSLDIARGLNFLRTVEILHRDIRAENILITLDKTAKLANFKLNRFSVAKSKNLERARYCAPELLERVPNKYDYKCEVYSFGILLWEIAEEKIPYQDINDIQEIADKVRNKLYREPFSENNQMPEEFKQLEIEAVDHDPDFRPKITKMFEVLRNCVKDHSSGSSSSNLSKKLSALKSTPKRTYNINQDVFAPPIDLPSLKYMTLADAAKQHMMYKYGKLIGDIKTAYECFETYTDLDINNITTHSNQIKAKYYKAFYISGGLVKSPPNKDKIVAELFKEVADDEADELPDAKVRYGDCLYNGKGVERNVSEALKYYEKAAEDGHKVAMYNVGNMYYNGIGCTKDIEKAKYYMKLAACSDYESAITFYKTHNF
ncbi:kinase-like domain-containing protein [Rhizophagus diaphanus]|nr:kinase-like domain-containing protein [Rhizophagus diaphanus] [Rhizophagus sp. MUCL 43196]